MTHHYHPTESSHAHLLSIHSPPPASGVQLLMYNITQDITYAQDFRRYMSSWLRLTTTPKGLSFYEEWGPNRYAANTAFLALLSANYGINNQTYVTWGQSQVRSLALSPHGMSWL